MRRCSQGNDVLILCAGTGMGGMEMLVRGLARQFILRNDRVRVLLPACHEAIPTLESYHVAGVEAMQEPSLRSFDRRSPGFRLPRMIARIAASGCDVVNIHYCRNFVPVNDVLAARIAGKRCIVSLHGGDRLDPVRNARQIRRMQRVIGMTDAVVTVSRFQAENLVRAGVTPEKIRIIPCGVSLPAKVQTDRLGVRGHMGLPVSTPVIATAGRLVSSKGIADLIEAISRLRERAILIVAGDGPERANLEALASRLIPGRSRFLGWMRNMEDLYDAADIFALPSRAESFGMVFAEAALRGVPCVAPRVGGVPEIVLDGITGRLITSGDIDELAAALGSLLNDPHARAAMSRAARLRAETEFTEARMASRYAEVLFPGKTALLSGKQAAFPVRG